MPNVKARGNKGFPWQAGDFRAPFLIGEGFTLLALKSGPVTIVTNLPAQGLVTVFDGEIMQALLKFSRAVDWLNSLVGRYVIWLILASTVISAVNAAIRKTFNISSNAYLEVQWYLFAASFLLAAGYTLLNGEHVKIDVISSRLSKRAQIWIDVIGFALFLMPFCLAILWFGIPFFLKAFHSGEMSSNAGGLLRWPVYLMMPLGFGLLMLQGLSELVKRVAFLMGLIDDPTLKKVEKTAEEELAEAIQKLAEEKAAKANAA